MMLAIVGILSVFLPGLIGYGFVCWMMPCKEIIYRLFRALLIAAVTCGLGFVGGYAFIYVRDPGPYDDGWHLNMAFIFGILQLVIGFVLGIVSLGLSALVKHDYEVIELMKRRKQEAESAKLLEKNT